MKAIGTFRHLEDFWDLAAILQIKENIWTTTWAFVTYEICAQYRLASQMHLYTLIQIEESFDLYLSEECSAKINQTAQNLYSAHISDGTCSHIVNHILHECILFCNITERKLIRTTNICDLSWRKGSYRYKIHVEDILLICSHIRNQNDIGPQKFR